ncbi:MAG: tRNA pseudouridine(55) synthase TruB [Nautilia sp.]|nr:MAG: tRNA pseudouridine(55) synthase TruB [Nautilia sp.]
MNNRLFVVNKPLFISSNSYLNRIKRKYKVKKAGFSGTLDPFAKGCLIVAFGQYTKLFRFLKKTPKTYKATIFLGAYSPTLDIEKIEKVEIPKQFDEKEILEIVESFKGKQKQIPPKYSAKKIDGVRAYDLARRGEKVDIKEIEIEIFDIKVTNYSHPFLSFEASVSEGTYIRSLGYDIAKKLGVEGSLTYLERIKEGKFYFDNEKALNPIEYLDVEKNEYQNKEDLMLGRKLDINKFKNRTKGIYLLEYDNYFAIIEIDENEVKYLLNKVENVSDCTKNR